MSTIVLLNSRKSFLSLSDEPCQPKTALDCKHTPRGYSRWAHLISRVSHLTALGGGKMRDPGNEVAGEHCLLVFEHSVRIGCSYIALLKF